MASKKEILISELFLESATNRQNLNRVFNFEIPAGAGHAGGSIFGIIKIDSIHPVYERLAKNITDSIESFYQEEHELDFSQEFEKALQSLNKNISDFISHESNPIDLEKLNIVIAAASGENMSFSFIGEVKITYFQKQSGKGFQIFDLAKSLKTEPQKLNATKLFENVMNGSVHPGDVILISGPTLLEVFNEEELQPMLISKKPNEAVSLLRTKLLAGPVKSGFTAIILKYHEEPVLVGEEKKASSFKGSLDHLKATEEETSRYLLGKGAGKINTLIARAFSVVMNIVPKASPKYDAKIAPPPREIGRSLARFFTWLGAVITGFFTGIARAIKDAFILLTNYRGGRKNVVSGYKSRFKGYGGQSVNQFNKLGRINKYVLIGALAIIVIFIVSLVYLDYKKARDQELKSYNDVLITISQKKDEAESSLIYGDEERARQLVDEALTLIGDLPSKKKEQREIIQTLSQDFEKLKQELRHVKKPESLMKISALPTGPEGQQINFKFLLLGGDNLLIVSEDKNLFLWKNDQSAWQEISWVDENIQKIITTVKSDDDEYILVDDRPGMSEVNIKNLSWQQLELSLSENQRLFSAAALYNSRLYVLDTEANQIFRHSRSQNNFGSGTAWVKTAGVDMTDGVSLAIDGSIYVLKSNGQIYELYTGDKQSWSVSNIDPPLDKPNKIWTSADTKYLYILEPTNKRIVITDKSGKLVVQYDLGELEGIKDFYVEQAEKVHVLADNGIWEFGSDY